MAGAIVWSDSSQGQLGVVLDDGLTFQDVVPGHVKARFADDSLDFTARTVFTIEPSGQNSPREAVFTIRYSTAPVSIDKMIEAGRDGATLTIVPDTTHQARSFDVVLVDVGNLRLESGMEALEIYLLRDIRVRRLDGGPLT